MDELTHRQRLLLEYMCDFLADNDQLPPVREIAEHFGFRSVNAAHEHRQALERKGYLERNSIGKLRFSRTKF